jgi:hypothetical protein
VSFTLSNSVVQKIAAMSPLKPITVTVRWFDDGGIAGLMAQMEVRHHQPHGGRSFLVPISKDTTNEDVLRLVRRKLFAWRRKR